MDFFEKQERARRSSALLVFLYALAVFGTVATLALVGTVTLVQVARLSAGGGDAVARAARIRRAHPRFDRFDREDYRKRRPATLPERPSPQEKRHGSNSPDAALALIGALACVRPAFQRAGIALGAPNARRAAGPGGRPVSLPSNANAAPEAVTGALKALKGLAPLENEKLMKALLARSSSPNAAGPCGRFRWSPASSAWERAWWWLREAGRPPA